MYVVPEVPPDISNKYSTTCRHAINPDTKYRMVKSG